MLITPQMAVTHKVKPEARNYVLVFHMDGKNQTHWAMFFCLPSCISKELGWKWSSRECNSSHSDMGWQLLNVFHYSASPQKQLNSFEL